MQTVKSIVAHQGQVVNMTSVKDGVLCEQNMLEVIIYIIDAVLLGVGLVMAQQLHRALTQGKPPIYSTKQGAESDLPSVTVCIPARNEAHALLDCLQKVLASSYEKLEIIVLDDASADDTSALIKSFASEGVRFVQGKSLEEGWLGKNRALHQLLQEASGSYVLFMDVDTRLEPQAIENMVRFALSKRATMVSVLPRREDGWRASVVASPLRYFWETVFNRPSSPLVASNAWLIRREAFLKRFDGFRPFKNTVQPEAQIAAALAQTNEYQFLIGTKAFGVAYEKKWRSQLLTSVRLLYPVLGGKLWLSVLGALDMLLMATPFALVLILGPQGLLSMPAFIVTAFVCLWYIVLYGTYAHRVWRNGWSLGALLWPLLLIQESILIVVSTVQHKRRLVRWKGRLIQPEAQS